MTVETRRVLNYVAWFALAMAVLMPILAPGENGAFPRFRLTEWFAKKGK